MKETKKETKTKSKSKPSKKPKAENKGKKASSAATSSTKSTDASSSNGSKSRFPLVAGIGVLVVACLCLLVIVATVSIYIVYQASNGQDNAAEDLNVAVQEAPLLFLDNLDFSSEEALAESLADPETFEKFLEDITDQHTYLAFKEIDTSDNTIEQSLNIKYTEDSTDVDIQTDWTITFPEGYEQIQEFELPYSNSEIEIIVENTPSVQIVGTAEIDNSDEIAFDIRIIQNYLYVQINGFNLSDILGTSGIVLDSLDDNFYRLDIENELIDFYSSLEEPVAGQVVGQNGLEVTNDIEALFENEETVRDEFNELFRDVEILTDTAQTTILFESADECVISELDVSTLLENSQNSQPLFESLYSDADEAEMSYDEFVSMLEDIDEFLEDNTVFVTLCNDGSDLVGFSVDYTSNETDDMLYVEFGIRDFNSSNQVQVPSNYIDLGENIEDILNQLGIFDLLLQNFGGFGAAPQLDTFDTLENFNDFDSSFDDFDSLFNDDELDDLGIDDFSFEEFDAYVEEYNDVIERFDNGELTFEEYLEEIDRVLEKYGYL